MKSSFLVATAVAATLFVPRIVDARCCATDSDCASGSFCQVSTDADGGQYRSCNGSFIVCNCDQDCAQGMRCLANALSYCPADAGACQKVGKCIVPWRGPCLQDADCGIGFTCSPGGGQLCSSSGCQAGTTCSPRLAFQSCAEDSDCPSGWSCFSAALACKPFVGHGLNPPGEPHYPDELLCYPPYYDLYDNSQMIYFTDPATAYSPCADAGATLSSGGTGGASAANTGGAGAGSGGGTASSSHAPGGAGAATVGGSVGSPSPSGDGALNSGGGGTQAASGGCACTLAPANPFGSAACLLGLCSLGIRRRMRRSRADADN